MLYLKADTVTEVTIGPAVDVTDGFTPVTGLVGSSADEFEIIKHGATATTTIAGTLAAITGADGYYALDLSATDTDTEGRLVLLINDDSLILPIRHEFMVVNANVFDSLFAVAGTDLLQTDVTEWLGTAVTLGSGAPDVNIQSTDNIALSTQQKADVNTEVVDVMTTDTIAELTVGIPTATPTIATALMLPYMALRNKLDTTSTLLEVHNDAGTIIAQATLSDDGTTFTRAEMVSG